MFSAGQHLVSLETFQECFTTLRHLLRIGAEGARFIHGGQPKIEQRSEIGVEPEKFEGCAHEFTQAVDRRKAFPGGRARRGQRRQERLQRIHQPALFPEGNTGHGRYRAGQLGQEFADGAGATGKRRIDEHTSEAKTSQGVLEG